MNPALKELGYGPEDRVVVIHADDIGSSHASVAAWIHLLDSGLISSASTMPVGPWFPMVADACRTRPDEIDVGVHLTLTSEWESCRWGPLTTSNPCSGLIDGTGYFWRTADECWRRHTYSGNILWEICRQIDLVCDLDIDITHIDSHMGVLYRLNYLGSYIRSARNQGLLPVLTCRGGELCPKPPPEERPAVAFLLSDWVAQGIPVFDHVTVLDMADECTALDAAKDAFDALEPGLTYLIFHPALDTPELRAMMGDRWRHRVNEYSTFMDPALRHHVDNRGIQVIGCRPLRDLMRTALASAGAGGGGR